MLVPEWPDPHAEKRHLQEREMSPNVFKTSERALSQAIGMVW